MCFSRWEPSELHCLFLEHEFQKWANFCCFSWRIQQKSKTEEAGKCQTDGCQQDHDALFLLWGGAVGVRVSLTQTLKHMWAASIPEVFMDIHEQPVHSRLHHRLLRDQHRSTQDTQEACSDKLYFSSIRGLFTASTLHFVPLGINRNYYFLCFWFEIAPKLRYFCYFIRFIWLISTIFNLVLLNRHIICISQHFHIFTFSQIWVNLIFRLFLFFSVTWWQKRWRLKIINWKE